MKMLRHAHVRTEWFIADLLNIINNIALRVFIIKFINKIFFLSLI
jgi:hypothetical protein